MRPIRKLSVAEQTAEHLREGIRSGRWRGELPGVLVLARTCDVSKEAMRAALHLLEAEGLISAGHAGTHRMVLANGEGVLGSAAPTPQRAMRVAIFPHVPLEEESRVMVDILRAVQRDLRAARHTAEFTAKTQWELQNDPVRIARLVAATRADAWVLAPALQAVQEFFAAQPVPAICIGLRYPGVPLANVHMDIVPMYREVTRRLLALGHRRIVLVCSHRWREPAPGPVVQAFTEALAAHGIAAGEFHVPSYEHTPEGVQALLESLFRVTPPTALLMDLPDEGTAALLFLARRGLVVPRDVSIFNPWRDPSLERSLPPMAHALADEQLLVRRIVRWVRAVARGCPDRDSISVPALLEPGGSLGPVRKG